MTSYAKYHFYYTANNFTEMFPQHTTDKEALFNAFIYLSLFLFKVKTVGVTGVD